MMLAPYAPPYIDPSNRHDNGSSLFVIPSPSYPSTPLTHHTPAPYSAVTTTLTTIICNIPSSHSSCIMNSTSNSTTPCVLEQFVPWSPSCPSGFIAQYKANSMAFAIAYYLLLMLHGRNFAIRLVKGNFEVKLSNSIMMSDFAQVFSSLFCMIFRSNHNSIHHDDGCVAATACDLRLSFMLIAL
jgi:hypothetical protein